MKILVVEPRSLFPADSGAKVLSTNVLKHLSKAHEVTLLVNVSASEPVDDIEKMRGLCSDLVTVPWTDIHNFTPRFYVELLWCLLTGKHYSTKKFCTPELKRVAAKLASERRFDAVVWDTLSAFLYDVDFGGAARVALAHNVEYRLRERQAEQARPGPARWYLQHYARQTRRLELAAFRAADQIAPVSPADAEFIRDRLNLEHVTALPPGVDAEYFAPQAVEIAPHEIVFTGSMDWQANQDAVTFFVQEVLPLVQAAVPDTHLTVVGRRPPVPIRAMAEADPDHVAVTGTVEDVRPYMARARVAVAPLRFGSGIKIKVFEAMAMAKPIVVTRVAAEGLPLVDRETAMIADTSQAMADCVIELLTNAERASEMGRRGRDLVASRHDWSAVAEALGQACEKALARRRRT